MKKYISLLLTVMIVVGTAACASDVAPDFEKLRAGESEIISSVPESSTPLPPSQSMPPPEPPPSQPEPQITIKNAEQAQVERIDIKSNPISQGEFGIIATFDDWIFRQPGYSNPSRYFIGDKIFAFDIQAFRSSWDGVARAKFLDLYTGEKSEWFTFYIFEEEESDVKLESFGDKLIISTTKAAYLFDSSLNLIERKEWPDCVDAKKGDIFVVHPDFNLFAFSTFSVGDDEDNDWLNICTFDPDAQPIRLIPHADPIDSEKAAKMKIHATGFSVNQPYSFLADNRLLAIGVGYENFDHAVIIDYNAGESIMMPFIVAGSYILERFDYQMRNEAFFTIDEDTRVVHFYGIDKNGNANPMPFTLQDEWWITIRALSTDGRMLVECKDSKSDSNTYPPIPCKVLQLDQSYFCRSGIPISNELN